MNKTEKMSVKKDVSEEESITLKDVNDGVDILEKLAKIFISIFSIFKSKRK